MRILFNYELGDVGKNDTDPLTIFVWPSLMLDTNYKRVNSNQYFMVVSIVFDVKRRNVFGVEELFNCALVLYEDGVGWTTYQNLGWISIER